MAAKAKCAVIGLLPGIVLQARYFARARRQSFELVDVTKRQDEPERLPVVSGAH
jgi:hypothetical protein